LIYVREEGCGPDTRRVSHINFPARQGLWSRRKWNMRPIRKGAESEGKIIARTDETCVNVR